MVSICVVCGKEFEQHSKYQRKTCSKECKNAPITKSNLHGRPPKPLRIKEKKPPPEPSDKWSRSSFTSDELGVCRSILTSLNELPRCKCVNSEKKVRVELIGSGFKASCEWCGFMALSSGSAWVGVETVTVEKRKSRFMEA